MRKLFRITIAALMVVFSSPVLAADWTDEWFNSVAVGGPGSFEGQKRGYLTGGSISGRYRMGTDNLFTVSLPRANVSCGGIDLFAGGISFLDPEYLVSKLENILQAAPAMAFSMALKAHCEQCEDIMSKLEAMSTYLNSIQVNDCRMANQVAKFVTGDDPDLLGNVLMEATGHRTLTDGLEKNWKGAQDTISAAGGDVTHDLRKNIESCPAPVKELLLNGSVVANAANRVGMGSVADLVRGYVGDVIVEWPAGQNIPSIQRVDACPAVDRYSFQDFLEGNALERTLAGACANNSTISIIDRVNASLTSIGTKIQSNVALNAADVAFVNQSAEPVWAMLRTAVYQGTVVETVNAIKYPVAAALAFRVFDDLFRNAEFMIDKAILDSNAIGVDPAVAASEPCDHKILASLKEDLSLMREELLDARRVSRASYARIVAQEATVLQRLRSVENSMDRTFGEFVDGVVQK